MSDGPPHVPRHEAADRAGKVALRAAHDLGAALAGDDGEPEPVVLRRGRGHRSLDALAARLDAALAEDEAARAGEDEARAGEDEAHVGEDEPRAKDEASAGEAAEPRPGPDEAGEIRGTGSPGRREGRP